jgi:hypothetical protein
VSARARRARRQAAFRFVPAGGGLPWPSHHPDVTHHACCCCCCCSGGGLPNTGGGGGGGACFVKGKCEGESSCKLFFSCPHRRCGGPWSRRCLSRPWGSTAVSQVSSLDRTEGPSHAQHAFSPGPASTTGEENNARSFIEAHACPPSSPRRTGRRRAWPDSRATAGEGRATRRGEGVTRVVLFCVPVVRET